MSDKQFNKDVKKYIKDINSYLICDWGTRRKLIGDLRCDINTYVESKEITDFSLVRDHFGEPKDIARDFLENADIKKIKRKMNIKNVVLIAVIIALIMWGIGITLELIDAHKKHNGYTVIEMNDAMIHQISFTDLGVIL